MTYNQFQDYITNKYGSYAYTSTTPYQYEKIVQSTDSYTGQTTTDIYVVDANTYANLVSSSSETKTFTSGNSVTINLSKQVLSIYDYENQFK
jgi:hypothetical protein